MHIINQLLLQILIP